MKAWKYIASVGVLIGVLVGSTFGTASAEETVATAPYGPYGLNCTDEITSVGGCTFFTITAEETVRVFSRSSIVITSPPLPTSGSQIRTFGISRGFSTGTTEVCVESPDGAYITCDTVVVR